MNNTEWIILENWGCAVKVENNALFEVALNLDDTLDLDDDGNINYVEVTAPENQDFLNEVNKIFGTNYKMEQFAGR